MIRATTLFFSLVAIVLVTTQAAAQAALPPTNLAVEVYYYPGEAPSYLVVSPSNSTPGRAFYVRFKRTPAWKDPAGTLPVDAVDIKVLLNDGSVKAIVSVLRGNLHEQQEDVGSYAIREREKIRIEELKRFGVEPFDLALVRVAASGVTPQFVSKSRSIELVSIQPVLATLPSYRLVVRNVSNKNIRAIKLEAGPEDRSKVSALRQGKDGEPLIVAGGTVELAMRSLTKAVSAPEGYKPVSAENQVILISTVIYNDLSYDGDAETAALFRSAHLANKIQIPRIIASYQAALASQDKPEEVLSSLAKRIELLDTEVKPEDLQGLLKDFPALAGKRDELSHTIAFELSYVKKDAVEEIQRFSSGSGTAGPVKAWLESMKVRYELWLSRLALD